jgi:hypothetical protein
MRSETVFSQRHRGRKARVRGMALLSIMAVAAGMLWLSSSEARAHCFVGNRFFPATLATDDPCVADEMSLPTIAVFKNGDEPSAREIDISGDFSKRITENFGISIGETWTHLAPPGGPNASGFQNLDTAFQYQLLKDAPHELALLAGVVVEWGGTGAERVGAERFSRITPTFFSVKASAICQTRRDGSGRSR